MKEKQLEKMVNDFFSTADIISYYSKCELHTSEMKLFKKYLKKKGKVLDLFCGAGRVSISLAKMGYDVIGIDNNLKMIRAANCLKRKYNIRNVKFIYADASRINFDEEIFDYVIIMENSLEHVPNKIKREIILKNINNWLRLNGLLITSFHSYLYPPKLFLKIQSSNINNLIKKDLEFNDSIQKTKNGRIYFHFFTPFEIKNLFRKTGFLKIAVITMNELDEKRRIFKNCNVYRLMWPFFYISQIAKKIQNNRVMS